MAGIEGDFWGIVAKNRLVASKTQLIGAGDAQIWFDQRFLSVRFFPNSAGSPTQEVNLFQKMRLTKLIINVKLIATIQRSEGETLL